MKNLILKDAVIKADESDSAGVGAIAGASGGSTIEDVTIENGSVENNGAEPFGVGSVAGWAFDTVFSQLSASGSVTDDGNGSRSVVGGLAGMIFYSGATNPLIEDVAVNVDVTGPKGAAGGLVGRASGDSIIIRRSSASGTIANNGVGAQNFGGLVGLINGYLAASTSETITIEESYFDGALNITDAGVAGGLVGEINAVETEISESAMLGSLEGFSRCAGLVGQTNAPLTITDSYSNADLTIGGSTAPEIGGGLIGDVRATTTLENAYVAGSITQGDGGDQVGGIAGRVGSGASININNESVYYVDTIGNGEIYSEDSDSYEDLTNAVALESSEMKGSSTINNMSAFDFDTVWTTVTSGDIAASADGYPILTALNEKTQLTPQGIFVEPSAITINGDNITVSNSTIRTDSSSE